MEGTVVVTFDVDVDIGECIDGVDSRTLVVVSMSESARGNRRFFFDRNKTDKSIIVVILFF